MAIATIVARKRRRARFKTPFTDKLLRPPGESLREEIARLNEQFDDKALTFVLWCLWIAGSTYVVMKQLPNGTMLLFLSIFLTIGYAICGFYGVRLRRIGGLLQDYNLGFLGERAIGEELNQMLANGYKVFHDVVFDGSPGSTKFNIDHVVVGQGGVFCVETKTRRKQIRKGYNSPRNTVEFDGSWLKYPWGNEDYGVNQARKNAVFLSKWMKDATADDVQVVPILALPGWFVERKGRSDVVVVSGREVCSAFPRAGSKAVLSPEQVKRIVFQLEQRCRNIEVE
jgi:hypothetical protein